MTHQYTVTITWRREPDADFARGRYSRAHRWRFDGGIDVPASASPHVVPAPYAPEAAVDPEEAYIASISSCHMLTFLDLARRGGFVVDSYEDQTEGEMEKIEDHRYWVARVILRPRITFAGDSPDAAQVDELHHLAHQYCFIANSVRTDIRVEPPAA
ncbi:OsmC family protein [Bauldia sp.]|uniref:OsmC family protein n=1 Tax=Bauldia sp. TaxID=2575872 RepID=UPI003BAA57A7